MKKLNKNETELQCVYDGRNSFYGKAFTRNLDEKQQLISYETVVAEKCREVQDGQVIYTYTIKDEESRTTMRHIAEWLKQNGFQIKTYADTKKKYVKNVLNNDSFKHIIVFE
ncbi:MAG: hypothetical protein LUB59_04875 [Candidatus Gastranaerophilales bacterium]|nr:hypothetical protein [Candidatus Gastranaerophilales bacterium]